MILSILIPSTHDRQTMLDALIKELMFQISECKAESDVEIITSIDNKERTVGDKRNELYSKAKGFYSVSIDSDDWVASNYISEHLRAAKEGADAIAVSGWMETNNLNRIHWDIAKDNPYAAVIENGKTVYKRFFNHISAIKSEICKQFLFESKNFGEDYLWALAIHDSGVIKTEAKTNGELYFYRYNTTK